jgi:AIPR protein
MVGTAVLSGADYPDFLQSRELLEQHIKGHLAELPPSGKGDRFAIFTQRLVPQTEMGAEFGVPELNPKKSSDEGIDLVARGRDSNSTLYIQAKLSVDRADDIDSVLSKFEAYTRKQSTAGQQMLPFMETVDQTAYFMLVTMSPLDNIIKQYEKKSYSSKPFYSQLVTDRRIAIVDGNKILTTLRSFYNKLREVQEEMVLNFDTAIISKENVYIGIISSDELRRLYDRFGDALFFENIRDFLGIARSREREGRTTPNEQIIKTVVNEPTRMLERNNGIVFKAELVEIGDSGSVLTLRKGSVVNGTQTTMCLVEYASAPSFVSVKIVETVHPWDITEAANFQNPVRDIDLKLARTLNHNLLRE